MPVPTDLVREVLSSLDRRDLQTVERAFAKDGELFMPGVQVRAVKLTITGTHDGPLRGPGGEIPATGRPMEIHSSTHVAVRDGLVTSWRVYFDPNEMLGQLGLLPG